MIYFNAFIFSGFICLIGELILDNTKLTPGHITSLFTVIGAFLSFLGVYPALVKWAGGGANVLIMNFGHLLYQAGMEGFKNAGLLGIFTDLFCKSCAAIVAAIVFSFVLSCFFKPRD